ncbi:MAG: hypothetical protein V4598_05290 [Bdellovibrionota bacterium]
MKIMIALLGLSLTSLAFAGWENPAVQCPEKILPQGYPCLDLSAVANVWDDFPTGMTTEEINEWKYNRAPDLKLCRYNEISVREMERPGTFTPVQVQIAWMVTSGGRNPEKKLQSVISASKKYSIPPHVLLGAITQESLLASLGISPDGGNYSCGIAQLNISEWCEGVQSLTQAEKDAIKWPAIACSSINSAMIEPFYNIAFRRLGTRPDYRITASDFAGITASDVRLPEKTFLAVNSFIQNCQNDELSIRFKANVLKNLFVNYVPSEMKNRELYTQDSQRPASCKVPNTTNYYPLHSGWLLAVAAYNAGPRVSSLVEHYFSNVSPLPAIAPKDLVEALHWGGKVRAGTSSVVFTGRNGKTLTQSWYKSCVVQRHVSRVVQHVTLPGQTILKSLEKVPCANGEVPEYRRNTSGIKETPSL